MQSSWDFGQELQTGHFKSFWSPKFGPSSFIHDRRLTYLWTVQFNLIGPSTLDSTRVPSYISNIWFLFPISNVCFQYTCFVSKWKWCVKTTMLPIYVDLRFWVIIIGKLFLYRIRWSKISLTKKTSNEIKTDFDPRQIK